MLIGIDIGGTKCAVTTGLITESGTPKITGKSKIETPKHTPYQMVLEQLALLIDTLAQEHGERIDAIGISCGSPLDSKRGVIQSPPNLPGWNDVEIVRYYEERFSVPAALLNDANACALAEHRYGAGRGYHNVVFLTFGTGMGAGMILNDQLYEGACGLAGEIGHMRIAESGPVGYGKAGSFEGFCSGGGIAQIGRMKAIECFQMGVTPSICPSMTQLDAINARDISILADAGDPLAREIYRLSAEKLGVGLSVLIDIINPEMIIIGSIFARSENLLREEALKVIEREALALSRTTCSIVPSALGNELGDYAALVIAERAAERKRGKCAHDFI